MIRNQWKIWGFRPALIIIFVLSSCIIDCNIEKSTAFAGPPPLTDQENKGEQGETIEMLHSLIQLQSDLEQQATITREKIEESGSDIEKANLEKELKLIDRQLAEADNDFERIATNVETGLFLEKKRQALSLQDEFDELIRPVIKEIKRLTVRSRTKTRLRETANEYKNLAPVAHDAVQHLNELIAATEQPQISARLKELLPEWENVEHRIQSKLELAELELARLEAEDVNIADSLSNSTKKFYRERGFYLLGSVAAFLFTLLLCRIAYRAFISFLPDSTVKRPTFHLRLLDLFFRALAVILATFSCFFVLYLAEDWFLLSMAIIFFLGLAWTIRQGVTTMWHQARLMLNIGAVREGERVSFNKVPWKVEHIHLFCTLYNPSLELRLRVPIEEMLDKVSRSFKPEEPWFPCKKGDWVAVGDNLLGKVVSLSHETVEIVQAGGKRIFYRTPVFLDASPVNLSRNFRLKVTLGISYDLQADATTTIPQTLQAYLKERVEQNGYDKGCLNLSVDFLQVNSSSLNLVVLADFSGDMAKDYAKLERFIQRCCIEACTLNDWPIPYQQLTFHWPEREKLMKSTTG